MFVGHYGVSFAAKSVKRSVPLWVWFIASQWLDVVWSILILMGVEKVRIVPGFTQANAYDLYYMPYTHSLLGAVALSVILGLVVSLWISGNRLSTFLLVVAVSFSHWILDLIVHVPDLPLYDNSEKVGFSLWRHVMVSFPLELIILGLGSWLYARIQTFASSRARGLFWGFVAILVALQAFLNFGPPPPSPSAMGLMTITIYAVLALLAAGVERFANRAIAVPERAAGT